MNENKNLTLQEIFELATKNHKEKNIKQATELYNRAIEIDPHHIPANNNLGVIFKSQGKNQKAINCYEKIIEIDPNNIDALNNLAITFKSQGESQKAINCYEKIIEIDPEYIKAYNYLGNIFQELKEHRKAITFYEKAVKINPNYVVAYNNLGVIFEILGEYDIAKEKFNRSIEIDPNYSLAHNNLGLIFYKLKDYQKTISSYEKAIEINPDYIEAHCNLGNVYRVLGKNQKAQNCYEKAIAINPNYAAAQDSLAVILKKTKLLSEIQKVKKSNDINKISFIKKIQKKIFGSDLRLNTNPFISYREVEEELINCLYKLNNKSFKETNEIFFGDGKHSENFAIFENDYPILKKVEKDLTNIMSQAVKSDIIIDDSFFNILRDADGGGSKWHCHADGWDNSNKLQNQKYSLTYHVAIGNQKSSKPGFLKFKDPEEEILPSKGMVMIFPAGRSHSAHYNGKVDRIMMGVNFYSLI